MALLPLTPFQRLLRQWEQLCPQNSAQVMHLDGVLDPDAVEAAWQATLRELGLGRVHVDDEVSEYCHEIWSGNPSSALVSQLTGNLDPFAYIQNELNHPFPVSPAMPYRPFCIQHGDSCHLGIIYQQWVADSISVRLLMREWFIRLFHPSKAKKRLIDLPKIKTALGPAVGMSPMQIAYSMKRCWRWYQATKTLGSFPLSDDEYAVDIHRFTLPPDTVDRLLMVTHAEGCTVNDLLIATLAVALQPEFSSPSIAIATSIDLRPYMAGDLSETFGSMLAYVPLVCQIPAENTLDLAQKIARQTRRLKDPEQIAQYLMLPRLLTWIGQHSTGKEMRAFYHKYARVVANMANVNLDKSWPAHYHPSPLRNYSRLASPNPSMPLSISASSLGGTMEVIFCPRRALLPADRAQRICTALGVELNSLVQSSPNK